MASNDEYQQRRTFEAKEFINNVFNESDGWITETDIYTGQKITYNKKYLNTVIFGTNEEIRDLYNDANNNR